MPVIGTVQCLWIVEFAEPKCYLKAIGLFLSSNWICTEWGATDLWVGLNKL